MSNSMSTLELVSMDPAMSLQILMEWHPAFQYTL